MRPVVIVMAKSPFPGCVKTRLTPPLSHVDAAALASCFVQDVTNSALRVIPNLIVAFSPASGRAQLEGLLPPHVRWVEQQGENLGERLDAAIAFAASLGFTPIIVTGADSPTLPNSFLETASNVLTDKTTDVVLGSTADGGYYLVAVSNPIPGLFRNVEWSTPLTYEQTASNVNHLKLRLLELPQWYDVDTFADLLRLRDELFSDPHAPHRAPATYSWMLDHDLSLVPF